MGRISRKSRILSAASRLVEREGAGHVTIDGVAAEAGLSKGGVLYHFPSKRAMLMGMLEKVLADNAQRAAQHRAGIADESTATLRAWILAEKDLTDAERAMSLALLAGAAEDPNLLDPAREYMRQVASEIRATARDPDFSLILLLATEGMRFLDMLNLLPLGSAETKRLHERLLELAARQAP